MLGLREDSIRFVFVLLFVSTRMFGYPHKENTTYFIITSLSDQKEAHFRSIKLDLTVEATRSGAIWVSNN